MKSVYQLAGVLNILLFGALALAQAPSAMVSGPGSTGGGEDLSPEFVNTVRNLPQVLGNEGLSKFSEINFANFQKATSDPAYRVEMKDNLTVNGAPKAALSFPDLKFTQFDPGIWEAYSFLPDGPMRKNVLAFHETLVIMKLEGNDDYHISNKLYSTGVGPTDKLIVSVGRITPLNIDDPGIIDVVNYSDRTSTFYTCKNRKLSETCFPLGRLDYYYSQNDFVSLHAQLAKKLKWWKRASHWGGLAVTGVAVGIGAAVGGPAGAAGVYSGSSVGLLLGSLSGFGDFQPMFADQAKSVQEVVDLTNPILLQGSSINVDYKVQDFQQLLQWTN